ncbi:small membrane A-kinase anchor protein [Artibeus jamaicensis]|uniref:small membrane A-kinase anchor protein n=1 Tax=Artibeus jamaicensis TaxID=9417 RepID=UPI00235A90D1|nr:small membrane A-kinase anchor protein [Artibeus jamaicensis]
MGCMKSKQIFAFPTTIESDKQHTSAESFMSDEIFQPRMPSQVISEEVKGLTESKILVFEFAHRLSQEILSDALQQWADSNTKYGDIPFIESEGP